MPINLTNISDRIICGDRRSISAVPLREPACRPLWEAGIESCCLATLSAPYHLTRDGAERPFHYTVWIVMDGDFEVQLPDRTVDIRSGMFFVIPSWIPRSIRLVAGTEQTHISFNISIDRDQQWLKTDSPIFQHTTMGQRIRHAVEGLIQETNVTIPSSLACSHYSDLILHYLKRAFQKDTPRLDEIQLQLANLLQAIRGRLSEKWDVARMAKALNTSRAQLFRMVKHHCQTTPNQLLLRERMKLARQLLTETGYSLDIIAEQVGYANPYTFSNVFYKHQKIRPGAYRKRQRFKAE